MLTICDGRSFVRISPRHGARILSFETITADGPVPWLAPIPVDDLDEGRLQMAGLFVLAPFSNRIHGAALPFRGVTWPLEPSPGGGGDAMHGSAARQRWTVLDATPDAVVLELDKLEGGWPWATSLRFHARLVDGALELRLSARNNSAHEAPIGLGFHPYFTRFKDTRIGFSACREWEVAADNRATISREIARDRMDHALYEQPVARFYEGVDNIRVVHPVRRAALRLTCSKTLPYWLAYVPSGMSSFCLEPVSHLTGAFQKGELEALGEGMMILAPSETAQAWMRMTPSVEA